jgi:hypothetical protein
VLLARAPPVGAKQPIDHHVSNEPRQSDRNAPRPRCA